MTIDATLPPVAPPPAAPVAVKPAPPPAVPVKAATNWSPHPKLVGQGAAGAAVLIAVWALNQYAHTTIPADVSDALVVLVGLGLAYMIPSPKVTPSA